MMVVPASNITVWLLSTNCRATSAIRRFGVPSQPVTIALPSLQEHQIRLQGCATYMPDDYARAIAIIQAGGVRAQDIVTARLPPERVAEAFVLSASGSQVKVLVTR